MSKDYWIECIMSCYFVEDCFFVLYIEWDFFFVNFGSEFWKIKIVDENVYIDLYIYSELLMFRE